MGEQEPEVQKGDVVMLLAETGRVPAGSLGVVVGFYRTVEVKVVALFPPVGALLALTSEMFERM